MPSWTRVNSPEVPELPVFGHAAIAGDQIYVSGMLGLRDDFSDVVEGGIGPETTQAVKVGVYMPTSRTGRR
jgi:enamine deaminase RidA (YjgF/YER057c/UK114 family)